MSYLPHQIAAVGVGLFILLTGVSAQTTNVIFSDDFESGTMANWTTTATNPLEANSAASIVPLSPPGTWCAAMDISLDRMHHNIIADNGGAELSGHTIFTSWIYDPSSGNTTPTRIFNEVRGYAGGTGFPNGGTVASGTLGQLLAIGKYNTVTLPGEVYNGLKYQGRVTFPVSLGWFNLNGPGSPNRSIGWHRFDIERMEDGSTINFYVDGILSRTMIGAMVESWDTIILGPGLGSTVGTAWIDGMAVSQVLPPALSIQRLNNAALISWPRPSLNFILEKSIIVTGPWSQVAFPYTTNADDISVTVPAATAPGFYRLHQP